MMSSITRLPSASIEVEVPFHDVDLMQIAWHGHYVKYLELARCAMLESIDYNYMQMHASGFAWPIVDLRIRYPKPATLGQKLRVTATMTEYDPRLKIRYIVQDVATGERLTKAETVQVAVDLGSRELQFAAVDALRQRLEAFNA